MPKVLIIDDDEQICKLLTTVFEKSGGKTFYHQTLKGGLAQIFSDTIDIVFLDVNLPDGNGLEAIEIIKQHPVAPEIIIITADENVDGAALAMKSNAWDYISKAGSYKNFKFALDRAFEYRKQKLSNRPHKKIKREMIVGESMQISKCLDDVSKAADDDIPVLITGETGTGKELFARAIHVNSNRSKAGFVVVDCAALPEHLVESALFGHIKGAFTGADSDQEGLMTIADKGTLFLDEVGELPLSVQKKFLRVLQEKQFRPVGGKKEIKSDFRLICATHRDLRSMVKENQFREDLFFRIFSIQIELPRLKDRENDIETLAFHQLSLKKEFPKRNTCTMSPEFLEELKLYDWPGNVRELIATINSVCNDAGDGNTLFPNHLPEHIRVFNIKEKFSSPDQNDSANKVSPGIKTATNGLKFKDFVEKMKYDYLKDLLSASKGDINDACSLSGLSKSQLYRLMQQYDLKSD